MTNFELAILIFSISPVIFIPLLVWMRMRAKVKWKRRALAYEGVIRHIEAMAGNPDAAQGCRDILAVCRELKGE